MKRSGTRARGPPKPLSVRHPIKETGEIRLIQLRKTAGLLDFALKVVKLEDKPVYKAVSYEWGAKDKGYQIQVDGNLKHVRKNLITFLLTLRDHDPNVNSYWLWIDQICIDHQLLDERSQQVAQMDVIYSGAEEVLCWLGSSQEPEEDAEAMRVILDESHGSSSKMFKINPGAALFEKPYWQRLWIVQEFLLAKKIVILFGSHRMELDVVRKFLDREKSIVMKPAIASLLKKRDAGSTKMDLKYAMGKYLRQECQDPRDKVYGLSGLLHPEQRVPIDYSKDKLAVFTDVLNVLLKIHFETTSGSPFVNYNKSYVLWDGYSTDALMYDTGLDPIIMAAYIIGGFELRYTAWKINAMVKEKEKSRSYFTVEEVASLDDKPSSSFKRLAYLMK